MSFTFNGVSSDNYKVTVEKCPSYPVAQRVVEHIQVPGRNGDLIRDTGAYGNVEQTYSIWFDGRNDSMQEAARSIALWLNGSSGYCRLEDTYDTDVYRMAVMSNYTEYRNFRNRIGRADVTFSCKPQRWMKTGESLVPVAGATLSNQYMDCFPIYAVTGNGTVTVDSNTFTVTNNAGIVLYVDSETGECWTGDLTINKRWPFAKQILTTSEPTGSFKLMGLTSGVTNLYINYDLGTWFGNASGILTVPIGSNFQQDVTLNTTTVRFEHQANSLYMTQTLTAGTTAIITGNISTAYNRNGDVTGDIVGVPNGGCAVSKTVSALSWVPRWWTL